MDLVGKSSPQENVDPKGAFRKLSNDAANRKYRRRSPVGGGSSPSDATSGKKDPITVQFSGNFVLFLGFITATVVLCIYQYHH